MSKKYRFNMLEIEITRKCNRKCKHCMRGDAQDLTMSTAIVDRIFEDVQDVQHILFGNGEALLEIDKIEYFIQKLIDSQWSTRYIELTTNGSVCDKRIIDVLERFCMSQKRATANIRISNDCFHNKEDYETAYNFYMPLVNEANIRIQEHNNGVGIKLDYSGKETAIMHSLVYEGRATELFDSQEVVKYDSTHLLVTHAAGSTMKHRIKILNGVIPCALNILANGNVSFAESTTYEKLDGMSIGNIIGNRLSDLIDFHNEHCLTLCSEADTLYHIDYDCCREKKSQKNTEILRLTKKIYERILELRTRAQSQYPSIPAQSIIERIQFPNSVEIQNIVLEMYKNSPYYTEKMIDNLDKYKKSAKVENYLRAVYGLVLSYLCNKRIDRKYPYWLFGNDEDINEYLTELFEDLDCQSVNNEKAFPCEPGEYLSIKYIDYDDIEVTDTWGNYEKGIDAVINDLRNVD